MHREKRVVFSGLAVIIECSSSLIKESRLASLRLPNAERNCDGAQVRYTAGRRFTVLIIDWRLYLHIVTTYQENHDNPDSLFVVPDPYVLLSKQIDIITDVNS